MNGNNMKISIIDHVGVKSGMNYYTKSLADGLHANKAEVFVYSNFNDESHSKVIYNKYFTANRGGRISTGLNLFKSVLKSVLSCKKNNIENMIINVFTADIFTFVFAALGKIFSKRLIIIVHDIETFKGKNTRIFETVIYNHFADLIVVHNIFCSNMISKKIKNKNKIFVINQGGYINFFNDKNHSLISKKIIKQNKNLLFFGQIKKDKGLDVLLNSMKNIDKKINLIIAGRSSDIDFSFYENIIDKLDIRDRVIVKNYFISDKEMVELFMSSNAIILPYNKIYQSAVLLMAMSLGLPVITSDHDSFKEIIVDNHNGFIFKKGDSKNLAEKVNNYIFDDNVLKKIAINAKKTIEDDFDWNKIGNDYLKMLHSIN